MNIFILDHLPEDIPAQMCNQHINKMLVESTQLLCTATHLLYKQAGGTPFCTSLYKPTHANHPCTLWLLESKANTNWLYKLVHQLEAERQIRSNYTKAVHLSRVVAAQAKACLATLPPSTWKDTPLTVPPQCMPLEFQQFGTEPSWELAVKAYRDYYITKDAGWRAEGKGMTWTNAPIPVWFKAKEETA